MQKLKLFFLGAVLGVLLLAPSCSVKAQEIVLPEERASPFALATYKNDNLYAKVTYGQPFKKDRKIFGELVPYGKIWRTGANEATEITFSHDVEVGNKLLKAGTYTLFTIPEEKTWTVIFNKELGQWGAYNYNEAANVLTVKTDQIEQINDELYEAMTISFEEAQKGVDLLILWDQTRIRVPIKFVSN